MAEHIRKILDRMDLADVRPELVEQIAALTPNPGDRMRNAVSFASKFFHFFVNAERFPTYDEAARRVIKLHLGIKGYTINNAHPYQAFYENFNRLKDAAGLRCQTRELDRYLWITGMYQRWLNERTNGRPRINAELLQLFVKPSKDVITELNALLPVSIERAF